MEQNNPVDFKVVAEHLRKPTGETGKEVAVKMNESNAFINHATIRLMNISENDDILEVGMGNGLFCKDILADASSSRYTGCDFSETMVEEAIKLNKLFIDQGRATFVNNDAANLPFDDNTFTKILTINTVYFWKDPVQVLREFRRVLRPGGKLFIGIRSKKSMIKLPFVQYGFTLYEEEDLMRLLSSLYSDVFTSLYTEPLRSIQDKSIQLESVVACGTKPF